jgi:hypothetical protein
MVLPCVARWSKPTSILSQLILAGFVVSFQAKDEKAISDFFEAIASYRSAYQNIGFSYLAIKLGDSPQIVRGRVFMNTSPRTVEIPHFKTSHVCAGYCPLKDFSDVRDLIPARHWRNHDSEWTFAFYAAAWRNAWCCLYAAAP